MELTDAPELSAFYELLTSKNFSKSKYCIVCLRTSTQRNMLKPVAFKQFSRIVGIGFPWQKDSHICHMCERQASNAHRFYKAAQFANNVHKFFDKVVKQPGSKRHNIKTFDFKDRSFTAELEQDLKNTRKLTQFLETEILVIDCSPTRMERSNEGHEETVTVEEENKRTSSSKQRSNREVASTSRMSPNKPIRVEQIIIDDDDEIEKDPLSSESEIKIDHLIQKTIDQQLDKEKTTHTPRLIPIDKLMESSLQPNQKYVIHPIMFSNGVLTVPTLQSTIFNQSIQNGAPFLVSGNNIPNIIQNFVQPEPAPIKLPDNITINPPDSENSILPDNNLIVPDKMLPALTKAPKSNSMLKNMLSRNNNDGLSKKMKLTDESIAKAKNDRIDWEDKIPMDVISFMDAVDPNAPEIPDTLSKKRGSTSLGSITAVRSLANERAASPPSVIIDLC